MSDPKDNQSFFRKVVKFVANPATDWSNLSAPAAEARDAEYAKSELKAMIERKRRNDFVRKREFDILRKVRREGLTGEQLAALGGSSNLDDSEAKLADSMIRPDGGVKAKIDEIEQQMVGDHPYAAAHRRPLDVHNAPTVPAAMQHVPTTVGGLDSAPDRLRQPFAGAPPPAADAPAPALQDATAAMPLGDSTAFAQAFAVEVSDVVHDPELDEAVISFANADFEQCERSLVSLTSAGGSRAQHAETWLVLFDLYRATGKQQKFESLAGEYAQQFGWSAPQWYSLPRLAAEAAAEEPPARQQVDGQVGWACPALLDTDAVARLAAKTQQLPLPWVFDWSALTRVDAAACARLSELFRGWMPQPLDMRWLGGDHLLTVLREATPARDRQVALACWQARLDALRLAHRADEFDEAAIDYCLTYEVSPPSWEAARCRVRIGSTAVELDRSTRPPLASPASEVSMHFAESQPGEDGRRRRSGHVDLAGQLVGDIGDTLRRLDEQLAGARVVTVSCARLIRVDFLAAGDLLNWVLARRAENRAVVFVEAHRLVALFFGAMGINEHARVKVCSV